MTKQIGKTIRSLQNAISLIESIKIEDYVLEGGCQVQGVGKFFSEYRNEAQFQLEVILDDLEEKYQEIHRVKGKVSNSNL